MNFFDDDEEIEKIKYEIIECLKKYSYVDLDFHKFVNDELENDENIKSKKKDISKLVNDMYNIVNGLGEIKWVEDEMKTLISAHCKSLDIEFNKIYNKLSQSIKEKYLTMQTEFYSSLREKLQRLSSLTQGDKLRKILGECFKIKKDIPYDRVKHLFVSILHDKYIYTTHKINPSCEHVVPRKIFNQQKPMNSDMHNLFLAPTVINNIRDVIRFGTLNDSEKCQYINESGNIKKSSNSNKYNDTTFFPEPYSRGRISRACAYFFTVYPEFIPYLCDVIDINDLKEWCIKYKPTTNEHKRNYFIYQIQKNVNPYIIYPKLIDHVFSNIKLENIKKIKYENDIIEKLKKIESDTLDIDNILEKYVDILDSPKGQMDASFIITQMEKLKSCISKIDNYIKDIND